MPNTVVKLTNAESTWLEAAREDRKLLINKKGGCEEMRIHFFTASSFMSFFTPGSKKQEEKGILPPFPQKSAF